MRASTLLYTLVLGATVLATEDGNAGHLDRHDTTSELPTIAAYRSTHGAPSKRDDKPDVPTSLVDQTPQHPPRDESETDISATCDDSAALAKRDEPFMPNEVGQTVTHTTTSNGKLYTIELNLAQTSPTVYSDTFYPVGSARYRVVISEVTESPGVAVQTFMMANSTGTKSTTFCSAQSIGYLTSVDFDSIWKRGQTAAPTPSATGSTGKLKSAKDKIESLFTPARRDVNQVNTMTILDEQPGHTTLNPEVAIQTSQPVIGVTVVEDVLGMILTVSATTDAQGQPSLATLERVAKGSSVDSTVLDHHSRPNKPTVNSIILYLDHTTIIKPSGTDKHVRDQTAWVAKLDTSTTETHERLPTLPLGFGAPIPKVNTTSPPTTITEVANPSGSPTVFKVITRTVTEVLPASDLLLSMDSTPIWYHPQSFPTPSDREQRDAPFLQMSGTRVPMTGPTQTIHGTVVILDSLMKYSTYDALHNAVIPTGSCHNHYHDDDERRLRHDDDDDHDDVQHPRKRLREVHQYNKTECAIERCMWDYMQPINMTTIIPALMRETDAIIWDYFTHTTQIHTPHWGVNHHKGFYYPTSMTTPTRSGMLVPAETKAVRAWPDGKRSKHMKLKDYHGNPACHDLESCHVHCEKKERKDKKWSLLKWVGIVSASIAGLFLICCLPVMCCRRHRKRNPERRHSSLSDKMRRKSTEKPQNGIVDQATDPANALPATTVAGTAAGTEAARDQAGDPNEANNAPDSGDNGRSTTGRRAEEGRGRVNFADGGKPGDEGTEKPSGGPSEKPSAEPSEKPSTGAKPESPPAATEHAEPQPVPDKDGADGVGTGRQQPDVGSMRGRKRSRPEGIAGLGF